MHQGKDKENVSSNNLAVVAISIQKKQLVPDEKPTVLKNLLKKSVAASFSSEVCKKTLMGVSSMEVKSGTVKSDTIVKRIQGQQIGQRQFEVAESQKKRRELLVQRSKEMEDKQMKFNFHANPAPKFKKAVLANKQSSVDDKKKIVRQNSLPHMCTGKKVYKENVVPSCGDPERLRLLEEKKKMLLVKYQETHVQFKAKPAPQKKQPFQPVHNNVKLVDPKPFKLQLTERLLMRSEFDKKLLETNCLRKKQEDVRKKKKDFEDRKLQRQKTEFRARLNPFRNH